MPPADSPAAPPFRTPFFYGWVIIAVAVVAGLLSTGSSQIVMGILVRPMTQDQGWSLTATTGAFAAGGLLGGLLSPLFGALADKYGGRTLYPVGGALHAIALLSITRVNQLWQFYVCYIVARVVSIGCLTGVVSMTVVTNWFARRRGRAAGLVNMSLPLGNSFWAAVSQQLVAASGWRAVPAITGTLAATLLVAPAAFLVRRRPEDVGLQVDGGPAPEGEGSQSAAPTPTRFSKRSFSLPQALRTKTMWLLAVSQVVGVGAWATVAFHQPSYVVSRGFTPSTGAFAISAASLAGAFSSGVWGVLSERYPERYLAIVVMIWSAVALWVMGLPQNAISIVGISFVYGLSARGESALYSLMLGSYFGRDSFGKISGFLTPFILVGVSLGPVVGSYIFEATGTYQGLYLALSMLHLLAAFIVFFARDPGEPAAPDV